MDNTITAMHDNGHTLPPSPPPPPRSPPSPTSFGDPVWSVFIAAAASAAIAAGSTKPFAAAPFPFRLANGLNVSGGGFGIWACFSVAFDKRWRGGRRERGEGGGGRRVLTCGCCLRYFFRSAVTNYSTCAPWALLLIVNVTVGAKRSCVWVHFSMKRAECAHVAISTGVVKRWFQLQGRCVGPEQHRP